MKSRAMTYCVVPAALAPKLYELLRAHFRDRRDVEIVVESRSGERRCGGERRAGTAEPPGEERRRIRSTDGRRAGDRRAAVMAVDPMDLPRRARRHAEHLTFVERLEPSTQVLEDIDSARLVARFQGGEEEVFTDLYMRYFDRVHSYLRIALRDSHDAQDAAQEVFLKVYRSLGRYERRAQPFRAWLFVIVRNHTLTLLGGREPVDPVEPERMHRHADRGSEPLQRGILDWISDRDLLMLIERLPDPQRQVLTLRYMLDLDFVQVASIMGRSPADVRKLHQRAVRFLEDRLRALGRRSERGERIRMGRGRKQYGVLRARRFALLR